ncbi:MAG TPA: MgtC/SapB family protein, partial [Kofleriaceae bacterium]|nr:MgtC/SapB family protein [Kofleriaceae bacterium]
MWLFESLEGRLLIALAIGLLIGAERERRKGTGVDRKPAGLRTFALVALVGGASAALGHELAIAAGFLAIGGLATASYLLGDRSDPGLTSEVALVLTYALGALAQLAPRAALACGVLAASLLALRAPLHRFTRLLTEDELRDALVFGISAAVVLPLLPDRTVDPWGVLNPFTL